MSYIEKTLTANEKLVYKTSPHWIILMRSVAALLIALLFSVYKNSFLPNSFFLPYLSISISNALAFALWIYGIYQFLQSYIAYKTSEYAVTSQRVVIKSGWLSRSSLEIYWNRIEAIYIQQTLLGRLFNFGSIVIVGIGGTRDSVDYVPNPLQFRDAIQNQRTSKTGE